MKGWAQGCFAATATIEISMVLGLTLSAHRTSASQLFAITFGMLVCTPAVWLVTCALTGVPALLAIRFSERFRVQSVLFFGCIGGAIGVVIPALLFRSFSLGWLFGLAGCLAGLDYWYVAGRYAGRDDLA